jgi:putative FmdB family regulatory protein
MPIYEYVCLDCSSLFELLIRGEEEPVCPACGKKKVTKQLSVPSAPQVGGEAMCGAKADGSCPAAGGCGGGGCGMGGPF